MFSAAFLISVDKKRSGDDLRLIENERGVIFKQVSSSLRSLFIHIECLEKVSSIQARLAFRKGRDHFRGKIA